jgi:hypothetical protein
LARHEQPGYGPGKHTREKVMSPEAFSQVRGPKAR